MVTNESRVVQVHEGHIAVGVEAALLDAHFSRRDDALTKVFDFTAVYFGLRGHTVKVLGNQFGTLVAE